MTYPESNHILVIESAAPRRQQTQRLLAEEGLAVTAVAEGLSAIRVAAQQRFALAVTALELPGTLDGAATLRQIRLRQPWLKALFVGEAAARPRWLDPEREDFIAAPTHRRDLLGCVFELLQRDGMRTRVG
ncbi:MAG TPA: response regulator [Stellaceae bacterium]|nr:response regulator [Stellaceae bacterium]